MKSLADDYVMDYDVTWPAVRSVTLNLANFSEVAKWVTLKKAK